MGGRGVRRRAYLSRTSAPAVVASPIVVGCLPPQMASCWRAGLAPDCRPRRRPNQTSSLRWSVRPPPRPAPQSAKRKLHKKNIPTSHHCLSSHRRPLTATARPHRDNAGSNELLSFQLNLSAGDLFRLRPERAALREAGLAAGRGAQHVGAVLAHNHSLSVGEHRGNDEATRTPHVHEI